MGWYRRGQGTTRLYQVRLTAGASSMDQTFEVQIDPRMPVQDELEYLNQFALAVQIRDTLSNIHASIRTIRSARDQINGFITKAKRDAPDAGFVERANTFIDQLTEIEQQLNQTNNKSGQDPIRFQPKLDNQFVELYGYVNSPDGYIAGGNESGAGEAALNRLADLIVDWSVLRGRLHMLLEQQLPELLYLYQQLNLPLISLPD